MKLSWKWLNEHVDVEGLRPEDVADAVTRAGLEVEGIERLGDALAGVVVARIVTREQHPDADRLSVCQVDAGNGELLQIVCGAPNARAGLVAPLAQVGATLPDGLQIKKGKLRGQVSMGMLCSGRELGLGDDHEGLLELPGDLAPGTPIATALAKDDVILELGITPNRGDCLSVRGVAREVAAVLGRALRPAREATAGPVASPSALRVVVDDAAGCPDYAALVVEGLVVGPSPAWLRERLEAIGQRSINNIVDVTNWVLFECGQPLHAFDLDRVAGAELRVRRATDGEPCTTLDGKERTLRPQDLVIADAEGPVAIAGVIGGQGSQVTSSTTRIALECAHFDPGTVRATRRAHGVSTDSSYRFERGVDPTGIERALARAVDLIRATQEGLGTPAVAAAPVRVTLRSAPVRTIRMAADHPTRLLGMEIPTERVVERLRSIGMVVELDGADVVATVPGWRFDLERPVDLVEEVGRLEGYDALPESLPLGRPGERPQRRTDAPVAQGVQPIVDAARIRDVERMEDLLADAGLYQASTLAMIDPDKLALVNPHATHIPLPSPLGRERSALRTTLLPGLLDALAHNRAHHQSRVALFEIANVFPPALVTPHEQEPLHLAMVLSGPSRTSWAQEARPFDGWDATSLLARVFASAGRRVRFVQAADVPRWAHPGAHAEIRVGTTRIGWVGQVHPEVAAAWDVSDAIVACEVDLSALFAVDAEPLRARAIPRTPGSTRDAAMLVSRDVTWQRVEDALASLSNGLLREVDLFDVYTGDRIDAGQVSMGLRFTYGKLNESLTDEQVDKAHARTLRHLEQSLAAQYR